MNVEQFVRDGYVVVRGAFDPDTAAACRDLIWDSLAAEGVARDSTTWARPVVGVNCPDGEPFVAAGTSPVLWAAYDELIGPGRWTQRRGVGGDIPVRFPSEEYPGDVGWHIEGSYRTGAEYWANVRSRFRGLLALFLFSDVGPHDAPTRLALGSHLAMPRILVPAGEEGMSSDESMPGSGRRCCAVRPCTRPAGPVTCSCAIRLSCTPQPGRIGARQRG